MKKQKKAIVASILASATMLTITAAASTQNISAYAEAKDMFINTIDQGVDYENSLVKSNLKITDQNGTVMLEDAEENSFYSNGDAYYSFNGIESYIFKNESYYVYPNEKVAVHDSFAASTFVPSTDEYLVYDEEIVEDIEFSQSYRAFISVFIDTVIPNDVKSQFKKSSDGTISVELNKNQIPELAVLGFDVMCEQYKLYGTEDVYSGEADEYVRDYDSVFAGISDAYLENVSLQLKGTDGIVETASGKVEITGVDESGNAVTRTITGDVTCISNGDATMPLPDLTGYKVFDEDAEFEGTATFTKGAQTYEVTSEEAYNSRMRAYREAYSKANNGDYPTNDLEIYTTYFDSVTFSDGKDAYIQK